jgi:ribosomal protein S18 acetylase RimI-like enzyme
MSDEIVIRASTVDDAPGLAACIDEIARERRYLAMVEGFSVDAVAAYTADPNVSQVVAVDGGVVVGFADVRRLAYPGFRHGGAFGMGLRAGYRGRGLGGRLLEAAITRAEANGIRRFELHVFRSNAAALRLYERHGFEVEGTQLRARILDGLADDNVLMCRWSALPLA